MFTTPYTSQQPIDDFSLRQPDILYSATLTASTPTNLLIPGSAPRFKVLIKVQPSATGDVWFAINATAAVPVGTTFLATNSELVDSIRTCREVTSSSTPAAFLSFVTGQTGVSVSVGFYSYQ